MGKDTGVKSKGDGTPMKAATKQPVTPSPVKPNLDSPFVSASKTRGLYTDLDRNCILDVVRYGSRTQRLRKNDDIVEISLLKVNVFNPKDGILRSFIHEVWPPGSELADHLSLQMKVEAIHSMLYFNFKTRNLASYLDLKIQTCTVNSMGSHVT